MHGINILQLLTGISTVFCGSYVGSFLCVHLSRQFSHQNSHLIFTATMYTVKVAAICLALLLSDAASFCPARHNVGQQWTVTSSERCKRGMLNAVSRRSMMEQMVVSSLGVALGTKLLTPETAVASGGATAGGAYLLSAKQRYNDRVKQGVDGYLSLNNALEKGDIDAVRKFFNDEDTGSWKDFSTAGYLLANAFRRNSTAAPDSLPSVKVRVGNKRVATKIQRFYTVHVSFTHTRWFCM